MVLAYFKKPCPDQKRLASIMQTDLVGEHGTQHRKLADYLRKHGLVAHPVRGGSLKEIRTALSNHLPVIVHYLEPAENDDHYSVITGMTNSHIVLNDPWNGKDLSFTHRELLRRWHDKAGAYTRWMLMVRPK